MHEYSPENSAKEYAYNKILEWQENNPRPPEPEYEPEAPVRQIVSCIGGFVVVDPVSRGHVSIHTLVEGEKHITVKLSLAHLQELLEKMLELECDMKEQITWLGINEQLIKQKKEWMDERSRLIKEYAQEFLEKHDIELEQSKMIEQDV